MTKKQNNTIITGYQFNADGDYIGEYSFPNNLDKNDIHLPPNTTLTNPPRNKNVKWDGFKWVIF